MQIFIKSIPTLFLLFSLLLLMHPILSPPIPNQRKLAEHVTTECRDPLNQKDGSNTSHQSPSQSHSLPILSID